jgi:hydrogenase nickel incorporation protein HypA/HybF
VHEFSIALGIVDAATEELERLGRGRVRAVHLRLGRLSGVVRDALLSAYPLACEGSTLEGSSLVITEESVTGHCPQCDAERPVASALDLRCALCGGAVARVLRGRDIEVTAMEVDA